jgi:hypothetical protein
MFKRSRQAVESFVESFKKKRTRYDRLEEHATQVDIVIRDTQAKSNSTPTFHTDSSHLASNNFNEFGGYDGSDESDYSANNSTQDDDSSQMSNDDTRTDDMDTWDSDEKSEEENDTDYSKYDPRIFSEEWDLFFTRHFEHHYRFKPILSDFWKRPVNENSNITNLWVALYLFVIQIKHRISTETLNSFLQMLRHFCPKLPKTFRTLQTHLDELGLRSYDLDACATCKRHVWPFEVHAETGCPICGNTIKEKAIFTPFSSFVGLQFATNEEFCSDYAKFCEDFHKHHKSDELIDWYNGDYGKKLLESFDMDSTFFCGLLFDGLNKSRSSTQDAWPAVVTSLLCVKSKRNDPRKLFMTSLITYNCKPTSIDTALIPFLQEIRYSQHHSFPIYNCITNETKNINLCLVSVSSDLAAVYPALGRKNWSSYDGCFYGLCKAFKLVIGKKRNGHENSKRCYDVPAAEERTHKDLMADAEAVLDDNEEFAVGGALQMSVLTIVPYLDLVRSISIDIMHVFFVKGVFNYMLKGTFDKVGTEVTKQIITASKKLIVKAPHDTKRKYRSLEHLNHLKAEEICSYSMYYMVPILCSVEDIPLPIIKTWVEYQKLVEMVCQWEFTEEDLEILDKLCEKVPKLIAKNLRQQVVTLKIHLVRHIPQSMRNIGPLRIFWCFPIENLLSYLRDIQKGRQCTDHPLVENMKQYAVIESYESLNNCNEALPTKILYRQSNPRAIACKTTENMTEACMIGKPVAHTQETRSIQHQYFGNRQVQVFKRARINGVMFHSLLYTRPKVKQSHFVELYMKDETRVWHKSIPKESVIGVITGFYLCKGRGYASVMLFNNFGIHNIGKFRIIENEPKKKILVLLEQIIQKCLLIKPPIEEFTLDGGRRGEVPLTYEYPFQIVYFE